MFCGKCGARMADDARFCNSCGAPAPRPGEAPVDASPRAEASAPAHGDMGAQVSRARARTRRRMPVALIVVIVILSLAATAFAAWAVYTQVIQPAAPEGQAGSQPVEADGTEGDDLAAQEGVYADKVAEYAASRADGWQGGESEDVEMASMNDRTFAENLAGGFAGLRYAFVDLGDDGILDMVVAALGEDGAAYPVAVYSHDGDEVTVVATQVYSWAGGAQSMTVYEDGSVLVSTSGNSGYAKLVSIEGGRPEQLVAYGANFLRDRYVAYDADGTETEVSRDEYEAMDEELAHMLDGKAALEVASEDWREFGDAADGPAAGDDAADADGGAAAAGGADRQAASAHDFECEYFYVDVPDSWEGDWSVEGPIPAGDGVTYQFNHTPADDYGGGCAVTVGDETAPSTSVVGTTSGGETVVLNEAGAGFFGDDGAMIALK